MKVRLSPLAVALGVLFATLSPAAALVHAPHRQRIAASDASRIATQAKSVVASTVSAAAATTSRAVTKSTKPARRPQHHAGATPHRVPPNTKHAKGTHLRSNGRTGLRRQAARRSLGRNHNARNFRRTPKGVVIDPATQQRVVEDAQWILRAQLSDGAIANYVDQQAVWPYLSNFAAMGLARATQVTGRTEFAAASWRWLHWYQGHENGTGFVTDYKISGGSPVSTGDMDSTDAYAGTFLLATRDTYDATRNLSQLSSLRAGIVGAVNAIEATQDSDGLTWAKPAWHVKYAMDQAETYGGLVAAVDIAQALGDSHLATRAGSDASRMRAGFQKLWNPNTLSYDWAVHEDGFHQPTDWSLLYPDALQQAWVVAFGLADPSKTRTLMSHFTKSHPKWDEPSSSDRYDSGMGPVGYWAPAGWALGRIGSTVTAQAALNVRQAAVASQRAWPFTPSDAGQLIVLETWSVSTSTSTRASEPRRRFS